MLDLTSDILQRLLGSCKERHLTPPPRPLFSAHFTEQTEETELRKGKRRIQRHMAKCGAKRGARRLTPRPPGSLEGNCSFTQLPWCGCFHTCRGQEGRGHHGLGWTAEGASRG